MMSYLLDIERAEREYTERERREGEYANGYCSCCGSNDGLDEDGNACGHCAEGINLLEELKDG